MKSNPAPAVSMQDVKMVLLKLLFPRIGLFVLCIHYAFGQPSTSSVFMEDGLIYKVVQVNAGRKVNSFTSFKDVVFTEFIVPSAVVSGIFGFSTQSTPNGCSPDKTISAVVQHGGLPLFSTDNSSWADHVFSNRSDFAYLEFPATESTWKLTLPAPREGVWFSGVFIKEPAAIMKQSSLFFKKCEIMYFASFLVSKYQDAVTRLNSGQTFRYVRNRDNETDIMFKMCLSGDYFDTVDVRLNCTLGCPLTLKARSDGLPHLEAANSSVFQKICTQSHCQLTYFPIQRKCQYVYVDFQGKVDVVFDIRITANKCDKPKTKTAGDLQDRMSAVHTKDGFWNSTENRTMKLSDILLANESFYQIKLEQLELPMEQPNCPYVVDMSRLDFTPSFTTSFGLNHFSWPSTEFLFIPTLVFSDSILRFDILPYRDTGGTLLVALNLSNSAVEDRENFVITACLNLGTGSRFDIHATCQGPILRVNSTQLYAEVLIPYPEVGTWHLNIQGQPLAAADTVTADMEFLPVKLTVKLDQCVKGSCGPRGTCRVSLNSGALITSACVCQAGWKGWDCSDSSSADSMSDLLVSVIFLTISNLIFIPATVVAIRRKYFTEAVVYGCTCFFSSFYHACDQPLKSMTLCIMEYSVLQFCDFYVSILSFWVTIIAMADLPLQLKSIAHCVGSIGIALGVEYEKTGLWVFAVPALTAVLILAGSWGLRSFRMKKIAPQKKYWLIHFLPGFVFAAVGLVLFAFVETKGNYKFVHSVWHITMAMAVICFLPPMTHRSHGKYPSMRTVPTDSDLSTTTNMSQDLLKQGAVEVVA